MAFPLSPSIFATPNFNSVLTTRFAFPYTRIPREPASITCISRKFNRILAANDDSPTELNLKTWMEVGNKHFSRVFAGSIIFLQLISPLPMMSNNSWFIIPPAEAVLYSPETKIPRTGELALRRAIPANTNMKAIQDSLEELSYLLRIPQRKPYGTMEGNVKRALKIAVDEKESILSSMPAESREEGSVLYASLTEGKGGLKELLESIKENDADKVSVGLASTLDSVAQMELLQAPGLSFLLPQQYLNYPRLTGRAVVEFAIEKGDGSTFSPEAGGQPRNTAILQVVLDGYSAPLTAGNFAKMVVDGVYDGVKLNCTDQAILSDGGAGKDKGYSIPLEIKPSGQFEPLYKTTLSVQDGELPVLPLSVYGAVFRAHSEVSEEYSSPNQFFFYLYDKRNAGLGGLSFDEGQFSVFGYTTMGRETLIEQPSHATAFRTCTLREAVIVGSIIEKISIHPLHSSVALLKFAEMGYYGTTSYFIKLLIEKKYALPYRVLDALVAHFMKFHEDSREMPVIWHQSLLAVCTEVTPKILRELNNSRNCGEKED